MTPDQWLGLACVVAIVGFAVFAFRRSKGVKRHLNRRHEDDWTNLPPGGLS
jgi:hypothetical protein